MTVEVNLKLDPILHLLFSELKKEGFSFKSIRKFISTGITRSIKIALELRELRKSFFKVAIILFIIILIIWGVLTNFLPLKISFTILYIEIGVFVFIFFFTFFQLGLVRSEIGGEHYRKFVFPNTLTLFRFLVLPYLAIPILFAEKGGNLLKFVFLLFFFTSITDLLDGYLSRKLNLTSDFGRIYDPVADTVFNTVLSTILYIKGFFPLWFFVLILLRYWFHVFTGVILSIFTQPITIKSTLMGKVSTFTISLFIALFLLRESFNFNLIDFIFKDWFFYLGGFILILTFFAFIFKGIRFLKKFFFWI